MSSKGAKGKGKGGFGAVRGGHSNHRSSPYTTAPHSQGGKESANCSLHGKKRSLECLKPCGNGEYECTPKHMCKTGSDGGNNGFMTTSTPRGKGGRKGAGNHDHLECSIHKKWRLKANLETDGWGGFCCSAGSECKTGTGNSTAGTPRRHAPAGLPADGTGLCSAHNKSRSWSCLEEDGFGGWQCIFPHQCKVKDSEASVSQLPEGFEKETGVCALHNKKRSMSALMETVAGLQCTDGMECKVGSRPTAGEAGDMIMDNGLNINVIYMCSAHQKNRSSSVLIEDGEGGWVCRPEDECKGSKRAEQHDVNKPVRAPTVRVTATGGTTVCSVHEKKRSVSCMENDGMGGMCCTQEQQCKSKAPDM